MAQEDFKTKIKQMVENKNKIDKICRQYLF